MIITYNWLDQYQIIGLNTYPSWFGKYVAIPYVTPSCRTASILSEDRTTNILSENRTVNIPLENRTVTVTCQ